MHKSECKPIPQNKQPIFGCLSWRYQVLSEETTHFSIVDQEGNAVAVTTTLNAAYGSKVFVEELGVFMNNEMDDFSSKPGSQNMFGLTGSEANGIAPKKRMLSSMTPTISKKTGTIYGGRNSGVNHNHFSFSNHFKCL